MIINGEKMKRINMVFKFLVFSCLLLSVSASAANYDKYVEDIQDSFDKAYHLYSSGHKDEAKTVLQSAYFEIFESLEGPIRINISSKKAYLMESQFGKLRKMVKKGESAEDLKIAMDAMMAELNEVLPEINTEAEIVDEGTKSETEPANPSELAQSLPLVNETKKEEKKGDYSLVVEQIYNEFDKAFRLYENGEKKQAVALIQDTYFDVFEASGMEAALGAKNSSLKVNLESYFSKIIALINKESSISDINHEFSDMKLLFDDALDVFHEKNDNFLSLFIYSLMIILREGFEALLIVTAIIAYLVKSGNASRLNIVYSSLFTAIVLSFVTAFAMNLIFGTAAGQNREILEGSVMLVAAALLLYVSYWLLSNASAKRWNNYIKGQIKESLDDNSVRALWFTVFLAVYREGAETVLFYQALIADATTTLDYTALMGGFLAGSVLLLILYFVMKFTAIRLPIKPFFIVTGLFIYVMSFMFIGQGIMEFVEGKIFEPTLIMGMPTITFLGIYPYVETIIPQAIVLSLGLWGLITLSKNARKE